MTTMTIEQAGEIEQLQTHAGPDFFARLDAAVEQGWQRIHAGAFWAQVRTNGMDRDLYQRVMVELYHYTRHNSINQAFAAWKVAPEKTGLLKFCYQHAQEELGHERMVVNDLESAGLLEPGLLDRPPLPPTQALISYLYYIGMTEGAVARLGYSYWAETAYVHLADVLVSARSHLGLTDRQMTFFVAHQGIDAKHAEDVRRAIEKYAISPAEQRQIIQVALTTLYLSGQLLEYAFEEYRAGRPNRE